MKFEFVEEAKPGIKSGARIKVLGIGGAGLNAIDNMINRDLRDVQFIVADTNRRKLDRSLATLKIHLGPEITKGLGAGADPEIGRCSAEESLRECGHVNLDFADLRRVMNQTGTAIMGMGCASGEKRAVTAARQAVNSLLLEDVSIEGAKALLINLVGASDMTMDEVDEASSYIQDKAKDAEIFWGLVYDDSLGHEVQVTVVATGIDTKGCRRITGDI